MTYQGQFRTDRATMCRLFGQPDENNTYLLDINGRKAKVYSKHGNTWTVEAETYQTYSRLITKIIIKRGC
jgi:outer membrane biogenesis lipoprotein LolB